MESDTSIRMVVRWYHHHTILVVPYQYGAAAMDSHCLSQMTNVIVMNNFMLGYVLVLSACACFLTLVMVW